MKRLRLNAVGEAELAQKLTCSVPRKFKFTRASLAALVDCQPGERFSDITLQGFGVLVGKKGLSYVVERSIRSKGRTRRIVIGQAHLIDLDTARQKAHELLARMASGVDPVEERRVEKEREEARQAEQVRDSTTLRDISTEFFSIRTLRPSTQKSYGGVLNSRLAPWMDRPIKDITEDECRQLHWQIGHTEGSPGYANQVFRALRSILSFAQAKKLIPSNPVACLGVERRWFRLQPRTRLIPTDKLPTFFKALGKLREKKFRGADTQADYLEFLVLTGARRNEGAGLRWENVSFEERSFRFVATKNHTDHILPMTPHLETLLRRRRDLTGDAPWVFPSPSLSKGFGKQIREARRGIEFVRQAVGLEFSVHDLRRTFASTAARSGVEFLVLRRLLNHKSNSLGVTGGYVIFSVEDLRQSMQTIEDAFLVFKAKGQGLQLRA